MPFLEIISAFDSIFMQFPRNIIKHIVFRQKWLSKNKKMPQIVCIMKTNPTNFVRRNYAICRICPSQTVFSCRGSYGVGKGALICLTARWRCVLAVLLVKTIVWWHLPSKTHSKINILIELLHLSREVAHFSPSRHFLEPHWDPLAHGTTLGRPFEAFRVPTKIW